MDQIQPEIKAPTPGVDQAKARELMTKLLGDGRKPSPLASCAYRIGVIERQLSEARELLQSRLPDRVQGDTASEVCSLEERLDSELDLHRELSKQEAATQPIPQA